MKYFDFMSKDVDWSEMLSLPKHNFFFTKSITTDSEICKLYFYEVMPYKYTYQVLSMAQLNPIVTLV